MPYCPTHGIQQGKHCPECGALLSDSPPASGDSVRVRSPEAHAHASANPTFVLSDGYAETRPPVVKCPKCGRRNLESDTFDCQGDCGRQNLCERHFDEEHEKCIDCTWPARDGVEGEVGREASLQVGLAALHQRVEELQIRVTELNLQREEVLNNLDQTRDILRQTHQRTRSLEQELVAQVQHTEQAETRVREVTKRGQQTSVNLEQVELELREVRRLILSLEQGRTKQGLRADQVEAEIAALAEHYQITEKQLAQRVMALHQLEGRLPGLKKDVSNWRRLAKKTESQVSAIEQSTEKKQRDAEEALRRAEEAKKHQSIQHQIGIEWVRIPAGEFLFGYEKHKVFLQEYWIAKAPVTNAQYAMFVQAVGHPVPQHWHGGSIPEGKEKHPVVNVSWHDARVFCAWAGLFLPTEQEWEKAVRGIDGRDYPWGNQAVDAQRCNFDNHVKDTTPVGKYPSGASPYGVLDAAGNVWEWCEDSYDKNRTIAVLKGGSWRVGIKFIHAAYRNWLTAYGRNNHVGFRCVRRFH